LLQKQIAEVSAESEVAIRSDEATNGSSAALLARLKGIGPQIATVLWLEGFYRHFNNRREVASYAGLVPTPWRSGSMDRARAGGNRQLRPIVTAS
jgi:transposase